MIARAVPQSWESSDESILTVDENGMARGLKEGTATVTVTFGLREFSFDVNVTGHIDGRTEEVDRIEPTYESEGSYTVNTYCRDCGELIHTEVFTIPKLNHETNSDSDEGEYDGKWTFAQNDEWFGWESYLIYNPPENKYILARVYQVTLPEDGRLQVDMTAAAGTYLYASIDSETDGIAFNQMMEAGKAGEPLNFTGTSDIMKAGTYTVTMGYNLSAYPGLSTPTVGKGTFYHKITYKALTAGEAEQLAIEKEASEFEAVIASLPDIDELTLDNAAAVEAAAQALEDLSVEAAALVSDETKAKVAAAVEKIRELREAAESGDNPGGDNPGGDNPGGDNPGGDNPGGNDDPEDPCAYGHTWLDANYYWADDYSSCTAIKRCKYNLTHILTETVSTTAMVTKPATYTTRGETTYTAAFTNKAFWSQTKTVANIPVLAKKANPITVKAKAVKVKYKSLKKKTQIIAVTKAFAVSKAQGRVTYKVVKFDKKAKKKINVNSAGKVTVKKGLKKGTYKIKVQVTAAGSTAYKAGSKTVTLTIKIK